MRQLGKSLLAMILCIGLCAGNSLIVAATEGQENSGKTPLGASSAAIILADYTFLDYFPSEDMATNIADQFGRKSTDTVTVEELNTITELELYSISDFSGISNLRNLQDLWLGFSQCTTLPAEIGSLRELQYLEIYKGRIETIPPEIGNLSSLKFLRIDSLQITTLPSTINNLTNLQLLEIVRNESLSNIPDISRLIKIERLVLMNNNLSQLPSGISNLRQAYWISCDSNPFTEAVSFYPSDFPSLSVFGMDTNHNTPLPDLQINSGQEINYNKLVCGFSLQMRNWPNQNKLSFEGSWEITKPDGSTTITPVGDGSEINASIFQQEGLYQVIESGQVQYSYQTKVGYVTYSYIRNVTVGDPIPPKEHTVLVTEHWADAAHPDSITSHSVGDTEDLTVQLLIPEGYTASVDYENVELNTGTGVLTVASITQDLDITVIYTPQTLDPHTITIVERYQDNALADKTTNYEVADKDSFSLDLDVLDDYSISVVGIFSTGVIVNINEKTVTIDSVEQDYTIELLYYKPESEPHMVTVIESYADGSKPDSINEYSIENNAGFYQMLSIPSGYTMKAFTDDAKLNINTQSGALHIANVTQDVTIHVTYTPEEEGNNDSYYTVTIVEVYVDGSQADRSVEHLVEKGKGFYQIITIPEGYSMDASTEDAKLSVNTQSGALHIASVTQDVLIEILYS